MSYKIITTALLVIVASALLINLAFKVKINAQPVQGAGIQALSKGCCGNSGGGCGAAR